MALNGFIISVIVGVLIAVLSCVVIVIAKNIETLVRGLYFAAVGIGIELAGVLGTLATTSGTTPQETIERVEPQQHCQEILVVGENGDTIKYQCVKPKK